jgi:hypothetical protein
MQYQAVRKWLHISKALAAQLMGEYLLPAASQGVWHTSEAETHGNAPEGVLITRPLFAQAPRIAGPPLRRDSRHPM